jgi:hypothetical protein
MNQLLVHLLVLSGTILANELFTIKPLDATSGIFYNNLGYAKISTDYHTLLSFTNISSLQSKFKSLIAIYVQSSNICMHSTNGSYSFHCNESLKLTKIQIPKVQEKLDAISHLTGHNYQRRKRGLFDGASYAFKFLFGIPDANDAASYSQAINSLSHKNRETELLLKQQISVISSSISNFNQSAQNFKQSELILNENIEKFNSFAKNASNRINVLTKSAQITDHLNLLNLLISNLNEECDVLITTILFAKQNIIHPSIITPIQLAMHNMRYLQFIADGDSSVFCQNKAKSSIW